MALIKCPECNNEISDKAPACVVCGCPASYFNTSYKSKYSIHKTTNETICFNILNNKLEYPKSISSAAKYFGDYLTLSIDTYNLLKDIYNDSENITNALSIIPSIVKDTLEKLIDTTIKNLYSLNKTIDPISFINKHHVGYQFDYETQIEPIIDKYINIQNDYERLKAQRSSIKASRAKWHGGGFGLSGAIKGAVMASALNAGSSLLHAGGDALRYGIDNEQIRKQYSDLYNAKSTKDALCHIGKAIINIYNAFILETQNNAPNAYIFTPSNAYHLFELTNNYETDSTKKIDNYIKCIGQYPGNMQFYEEIGNLTNKDLNSEFEDFFKFWNINSPFANSGKKLRLKNNITNDNITWFFKLSDDKQVLDKNADFISLLRVSLNHLKTKTYDTITLSPSNHLLGVLSLKTTYDINSAFYHIEVQYEENLSSGKPNILSIDKLSSDDIIRIYSSFYNEHILNTDNWKQIE